MFIKIYDYANNVTELVVPDDKEISEIFVQVMSGDETGYIRFTDGTYINFDASDCRILGFNDGCYSVEGEKIKRWLEFEPKDDSCTWSYARQEELGY